ncbi:DUF7526 family protein [Halospeciosus flavus]|uniref:Uncharacterized protein n=1 Tax=Halospeciosus flavus TaxID=3032283 RepID=A0ABD5Z350_9EURY|nr:hypothetical protein [Halospeciosus flavus]
MAETLEGEVVHVIPPEKLDEHDLDPDLRDRAESRYVLVCREGAVGWIDRLLGYLGGKPIEAVTVVVDEDVGSDAEEGDVVSLDVEETELPGVYDATAQ